MNNTADSLAFFRLKPLLVNVLGDCSVQNITYIENAICDLEADSIQKLNEYILLPFMTSLHTESNERITIKCIDFLTFMFKRIQLENWKYFDKIFSLLILRITNVEDMNKTASISEELKLSVCECLVNLISCSTEQILNEMYSLTFRPPLAHAFFVLKAMLEEEKSKTLLKTILKTIGALCYDDTYLKSKYQMTEYIASESLASCLPGLSIALCKVITGDDKQAHTIITMAIDILGKLIVLTVGDESLERGIANDNSSEIHSIAYKCGKLFEINSEINIVGSIPPVLKNETWFKSVAENLKLLIEDVTLASAHSHWKVRYYILKFSELMLCDCSKTLKNCTSILLSVIFRLSVDSNEMVSSSAKDFLASLSQRLPNMNSLSEIIEGNIESLISQLIKCKFSTNDAKTLSVLKSLLGYIEISNLSLNRIDFSLMFFKRIILILLSFLEFDISDLNLIEELPTVDDFSTANPAWPKKRFKYFVNEDILCVICRVCYFLGKIQNASVLIEYLLGKLTTSSSNTLQGIFLIGSVIKGFSNELDAPQKNCNFVGDILEVFLSPSFFDVPLSNKDTNQQVSDESAFLSCNVLNKNKLQVCLLLEAIANCSEYLKSGFKIHLMTVLCPVMEKAGSTNYIISQCGRLCLQHIANFCEYKSVENLIKDNADYITNFIMLNFNTFLHKPEIAVVLHVAMQYNDADAIVLFRDLILQILGLLDHNQDKAGPLLHVLLSVAVFIRKWFPCKKDLKNDSSENSKVIIKSLREVVEDYKKIRKASGVEICADNNNEDLLENENPTEGNSEINDDDYVINENKSKIPLHINIICEIFKHCAYWQSFEDRFARMLSLEIAEVCILALRDFENQLHPLVHEFWSPFLRRFAEDTFVPKAFNVLLTIANECGDFIKNRTFKEVMPKIILFLEQECSKSHLRFFRQYQYTHNHSLQTLLLSEVGNLCTKLYIEGKELNSVATVCLSYLKKEQPKVLQEAAVKSLKFLSTIDPDAIWYYWNVAYSKDGVLNPPQENLATISFPYCDNSLTSVNIVF